MALDREISPAISAFIKSYAHKTQRGILCLKIGNFCNAYIYSEVSGSLVEISEICVHS